MITCQNLPFCYKKKKIKLACLVFNTCGFIMRHCGKGSVHIGNILLVF